MSLQSETRPLPTTGLLELQGISVYGLDAIARNQHADALREMARSFGVTLPDHTVARLVDAYTAAETLPAIEMVGLEGRLADYLRVGCLESWVRARVQVEPWRQG